MSVPESPLSFIGYKIDKFDLKIKPSLDLIKSSNLDPKYWNYKLEIRTPVFFKKLDEYAGGIEFSMAYFAKDTPDENKISENALIELHTSIVGIFKTEKLSGDLEQKLIKNSIPFILLPHLRAAITNIFASSGYGSVAIPLINIIAVAEKKLENIPVTIEE
jgi:preprotein translocase subunit SecB